jgi:hypothetical protein
MSLCHIIYMLRISQIPELPHWLTGAFNACAQEILGESFDPITELRTGADLMGAMVQAAELGDWDYTGMLTALLRHRVHA